MRSSSVKHLIALCRYQVAVQVARCLDSNPPIRALGASDPHYLDAGPGLGV